MKKQLLMGIAGASALLGFFLLRKKFASREKKMEKASTAKKHHITQAFAKAKKHAAAIATEEIN